MTMISLGGVIGAGLFVGSGAVMNQTGPAAILSYLAAGLLVVLVMRMLGEMAVANPRVGSFMEYCRAGARRRGPASRSAGSTGTSGRSSSRSRPWPARRSCSNWLPGVPMWVMSLVLMTALTATNLWSVRSFGEFEFWFASIKVAAIIVFIVIGAGLAAGDRRRRLARPVAT